MMDQILNLGRKIISCASTSHNPKALRIVMEEALEPLREDRDLTVEYFERNQKPSALIYRGKTRAERFRVILNAHLDVVEGSEDLFKPYESDGKLYGRGAIDMKSAAAAEVFVFRELARTVNYPLALQLVTDEEVGGFDGTKYQIEEGVVADFVLAGEPTDFGVNTRAKGIIWLKIKTEGISAHGAYPWQGKNALWQAKRILDKIEGVYPVPREEIWKTTFNLARIETSNQAFNKVPDEAVLSFDIRYVPEEFGGLPFEKGKDLLVDKLKHLVRGLGEAEVCLFEPPQFTDEKNPFVLKLGKSVRKVTGRDAKNIVKHGGSDIRHFNREGCAGVTFGPVGGGLHSDCEWVEIKSLSAYYQILKEFLLLCAG